MSTLWWIIRETVLLTLFAALGAGIMLGLQHYGAPRWSYPAVAGVALGYTVWASRRPNPRRRKNPRHL